MKDIVKLLVVNVAVASVVAIVTASYMRNPRLERLIWPFLVSMVYSTLIGGLAWWILPRLGPRFSGNTAVRWAQLVGVLSLLSLVGGTAGFVLLEVQPFARLNMDYKASMVTCLVLTLLIGCISYVVEAAKYRLQASTLELKTRELDRERALKAASDAKLKSLESRIHPHFLFNTLNSISSLVRSDPAQAEALIERLAALLRFSLDRHGSLVSLEDEVRITRDYLGIEKARFGERLQYRFEVAEDLMQVPVPAMSLQTLAENSVKYAVSVQRAGAEIVIRARRAGDTVALEVTDTGPGFSPDSLPAGHGLDSLKERLDALFGQQSALTAKRLNPGMEVAFRVPC